MDMVKQELTMAARSKYSFNLHFGSNINLDIYPK